MKKTLLSITDLIFLTRPVVIAPVWGFAAFGMYRYHERLAIIHDPKSYILILLYSLSVGAVYVINQIADIEVDKDNDGFPLLVKGNISTRSALITAAVCAVASVAGPILLGRPSIAILSTAAICAGCVYSCRPFSLSGRPFFDFLTNAFEAALAFAAGWCAVGGSLLDPLMYRYALPYFLLMCAGSIGSTYPDIPGDRRHGKITTAVRYGAHNANYIAMLALSLSVPVSIILADFDMLALLCAALAMPLYIVYALRPSDTTMELTYKVGGAATMLAASIAAPAILPAGILVFAATWLYFRYRHNISYPSLKPAKVIS